ncbi:MAG: pseudouridine synthase [Verrucomicrobiota bacterium]
MSDGSAQREWLPWGKGVRLIASHPSGLLALEKPPGVLSHPNPDDAKSEKHALFKAPYDFERECYHQLEGEGAPEVVHLLHRLDSATSGVILVSTDDKVAETIRARFQSNDAEKTYYAVVKGTGRPGMHGQWVDRLEKSKRGSGGPVHMRSGRALEARTGYFWERSDRYHFGLSLMKLMPLTGRTHQLRYQCSKHKMPILGDRVYGEFRFNRLLTEATGNKRLYLHAAKIQVKFLYNGEMVRFGAESPIPKMFDEILGDNEEWVSRLTKKPTHQSAAARKLAQVRDSLRGPHARRQSGRHRGRK